MKIKLGPPVVKYQGKIFTIREREVTFADSSKDIYEYCERPNSVSILAFNDKNEILLIREYRHNYHKTVWFLPSGRIDHKSDTPRSAAQRELREETGYRAKKMKLVAKKSPSNTILWNLYIFAAKNLVQDPLPMDRGEIIKPFFVPFKKAVQMALDGTIENNSIAYNIIRFDQMLKKNEFHW
jgi:ADP-ribose pyrophosphatase